MTKYHNFAAMMRAVRGVDFHEASDIVTTYGFVKFVWGLLIGAAIVGALWVGS